MIINMICGSSQSSGINYDGSRLVFHIQIRVFTVLLPRDQKKLFIAFHSQTNG